MQRHQVAVLSTVIDDMSPEIFGALMNLLLSQGAWEVTYTAAQTKKNRPATRLEVVCSPDLAWPLAELVLEQSSSLGIRVRHEERWCLERQPGEVRTSQGLVSGKWIHRPSGRWEFQPEFEDCLSLARANKSPLSEIFRLALAAAQNGRPLPRA